MSASESLSREQLADAEWKLHLAQRALDGGVYTAPEVFRQALAELVPVVASLLSAVER